MIINDVIAVPREVRMWFFFNHNKKISGRSAPSACVALAVKWNIIAFGNAGRYDSL